MLDYEYLIHLLYSYINDTQPMEKPEEVSFENVYNLGRIHEVGNIAFLSVEKLKEKPEAELYNSWKVYYYFSVERDSKQQEGYENVIALLHSGGIRTVEAQGTVTKTLYPESYLRMMSDIDLIVDFENFAKTQKLLVDNGFVLDIKQETEFDAKSPDGLELDFHCDFFTKKMHNRTERYSDSISSPFEHSLPDENDKLKYVLDDTYFYLYSLLHTIKHYEIAGCGIRRILDLYYLKKAYSSKIDSEYVSRVIAENGFEKSCEALFDVEQLWFEGKACERDISQAVYDIVMSGTHGSEAQFIRNNLKKDKESGVHFPKLRRIAGIFFPSAEYIYLEYPEFREKGYSLFKCRMLRIVRRTKRFKVNNLLTQIKKIVSSK